jgi:hypothetical protein
MIQPGQSSVSLFFAFSISLLPLTISGCFGDFDWARLLEYKRHFGLDSHPLSTTVCVYILRSSYGLSLPRDILALTLEIVVASCDYALITI